MNCPNEPQFLPEMAVTQSASVAAGRAMRQVQPLTQKGEIQDNLELAVAAKRLLPRGSGDDYMYSATVQVQLKAWEAFRPLGVARRENPHVASGDFKPRRCPWAQFYDQMAVESSGLPVVTTRVAETKCSQTSTADLKLRQRPVIQLPKMGEEKLKSISSKGSTRQPRTSTPTESVHSRPPETESMEVDTPAVQATSKESSARNFELKHQTNNTYWTVEAISHAKVP